MKSPRKEKKASNIFPEPSIEEMTKGPSLCRRIFGPWSYWLKNLILFAVTGAFLLAPLAYNPEMMAPLYMKLLAFIVLPAIVLLSAGLPLMEIAKLIWPSLSGAGGLQNRKNQVPGTRASHHG